MGDTFLQGSLTLSDLQLGFPQDMLDSYELKREDNIYF